MDLDALEVLLADADTRVAAAGVAADGAKFLRTARTEAYVDGGGDLADRVGRTRARRQRGGGGDEDL